MSTKDAQIFFEKFKAGLLGEMHTCTIGTVEHFDPVAMKCDVVLHPDGALVKSVPVAPIRGGGFFIRCPLAPGDMVILLFSHREIDSVMHGDEAQSDRKFAVDDAIAIAGIGTFDDPLPAANATDLIIGKRDMSAKMIFGADGTVTIDAPAGVTIKGKTTTGSW